MEKKLQKNKDSLKFWTDDLGEAQIKSENERHVAYYAIIPASVRYSNISSSAKLMYGEITALCNKKGYCWASNQYFAELYNVSNRSITNWISELKQLNAISIADGSNESRKIYIVEQYKK